MDPSGTNLNPSERGRKSRGENHQALAVKGERYPTCSLEPNIGVSHSSKTQTVAVTYPEIVPFERINSLQCYELTRRWCHLLFTQISPLTYAVYPWSVHCECAIKHNKRQIFDYLHIRYTEVNVLPRPTGGRYFILLDCFLLMRTITFWHLKV